MDLVNALRFNTLSDVLSLTQMRDVVIVMVALVSNNQVNNNFQYNLLKLFVASTVGLHNPIMIFSAATADYLCYDNYNYI